MQIKQLANKKIQFWVKAGGIKFSCLPAQNYQVRNDKIEVVSIGGILLFTITPTEITHVQILGGALTPQTFSTAQELAVFLDDNFFFESVAPTNIFSDYGNTGEWNQGHSAIKPIIVTSTALTAGVQHSIPYNLDGTITDFSLIKINASLAGAKFNFAIYDVTKTGAEIPNNKVYQSPEFTTAAVREQLIDTLSTPQFFPRGKYYFSYIADTTGLTFTGTRVAETYQGFILTGTPAFSTITRLFKAGSYVSTLPDVYPSGFTKDLANPANPMLFFKKQV